MQSAVLQLVGVDEAGRYTVGAEASAWLEGLASRELVVASVAGRYRTGKSLLVNRALLQRHGGTAFAVGPTVQACTKGVWLFAEPLELPDGRTLVVLDTEGIGSLDASAAHDAHVLSLALLLSSIFLYNSVGAIDEGALQALSLVVHVADKIAPDGAGAFPAFEWVLRDFTLRLVDQHQKPLTPAAYLEQALAHEPRAGDDSNAVRTILRERFGDRGCTTLVRPMEDEAMLQDLDTAPDEALRPAFREGLEAVRARVAAAPTKRGPDGTQSLGGPALAALTRALVDAINAGKAPSVRGAWTLMVRAQAAAAASAARAVWREAVDALPPQAPEAAEASRRAALAAALAAYDAEALAGGGEQPERAELVREMEAEIARCRAAAERFQDEQIRDALASLDAAVESAPTFRFFVERHLRPAGDAVVGRLGGGAGARRAWAAAALEDVYEWASRHARTADERASDAARAAKEATARATTAEAAQAQLQDGLARTEQRLERVMAAHAADSVRFEEELAEAREHAGPRPEDEEAFQAQVAALREEVRTLATADLARTAAEEALALLREKQVQEAAAAKAAEEALVAELADARRSAAENVAAVQESLREVQAEARARVRAAVDRAVAAEARAKDASEAATRETERAERAERTLESMRAAHREDLGRATAEAREASTRLAREEARSSALKRRCDDADELRGDHKRVRLEASETAQRLAVARDQVLYVTNERSRLAEEVDALRKQVERMGRERADADRAAERALSEARIAAERRIATLEQRLWDAERPTE
jgi:hypothetical protein